MGAPTVTHSPMGVDVAVPRENLFTRIYTETFRQTPSVLSGLLAGIGM